MKKEFPLTESPNAADLSDSPNQQREVLTSLMEKAKAFDPISWARDLAIRTPHPNVARRDIIASAHRAAVIIYLSRALIASDPYRPRSTDLESIVTEALHHLSPIQPPNPMFIGTIWPTFIVGAETSDPRTQKWVADRFEELANFAPMHKGVIRAAVHELEYCWTGKRMNTIGQGRIGEELAEGADFDWLAALKRRKANLLIA